MDFLLKQRQIYLPMGSIINDQGTEEIEKNKCALDVSSPIIVRHKNGSISAKNGPIFGPTRLMLNYSTVIC